jgi:hypothetical protein
MSIETVTQKCHFYVHKVPNHHLIKNKILKAISEMGLHSTADGNQKITNTDWYLPTSYERPYFEYLEPVLLTHVNELAQAVEVSEHTSISLKNYWFQQYKEGDFHEWHMHENSLFSSVYYVDLPSGAAKTSFKCGEESFDVPVKEGCILTFPACFLHCSKPNKKATKTVISFNY